MDKEREVLTRGEHDMTDQVLSEAKGKVLSEARGSVLSNARGKASSETKAGVTGAVLVVGAGIGGMQASLDLAEAGLKVYLVEKSPAIGGVMAQLDKTFPTNDCAMCILRTPSEHRGHDLCPGRGRGRGGRQLYRPG